MKRPTGSSPLAIVGGLQKVTASGKTFADFSFVVAYPNESAFGVAQSRAVTVTDGLSVSNLTIIHEGESVMRKSCCSRFLTITLVVPLLALWGCTEALPVAGPAVVSEAPFDILNSLVAGDVADAFERYRNGVPVDVATNDPIGVSDEQRTVIEALQQQLDLGDILEEDFFAGVGETLQDAMPISPFARFGFLRSPFSVEGLSEVAILLGVTPEQQDQALMIFRLLQGDLASVRDAAKEEIRAVLDAEQEAILDQLSDEIASQVGLPEGQEAGARLVLDVLVLKLGLTLDQQSQMEAVREDLRVVGQGLFEDTRGDFLGILGPGQSFLFGILESFAQLRP